MLKEGSLVTKNVASHLPGGRVSFRIFQCFWLMTPFKLLFLSLIFNVYLVYENYWPKQRSELDAVSYNLNDVIAAGIKSFTLSEIAAFDWDKAYIGRVRCLLCAKLQTYLNFEKEGRTVLTVYLHNSIVVDPNWNCADVLNRQNRIDVQDGFRQNGEYPTAVKVIKPIK